MTNKCSSDKIDDRVPELVYDRDTGFLYLTDGQTRQNVMRVVGHTLFLWFRASKKEYPYRLDKVLSKLFE